MRTTMDSEQQTEIEAAAFRKLVAHLQQRTDVQNIDVMGLAGFCRNCLAKWLVAGADEAGAELSYDDARTAVYGMPYGEWKTQHQAKATEDQLARFKLHAPWISGIFRQMYLLEALRVISLSLKNGVPVVEAGLNDLERLSKLSKEQKKLLLCLSDKLTIIPLVSTTHLSRLM